MESIILTLLLVALCVAAAIGAGLVLFTGWVARRAVALVPPVGRYVHVEGLRLHYLDEGEGPVLLLIHGLASQVQSFTYALSPLLRARYRVLILDRPGNGYSQESADAGLGGQARIVAGFLDALGIEKALVVGHSLGGAIALALAADYPDRVAALALISPASQVQDAPPPALRALALRSDLARWIVGWTVAVPASIIARDMTLKALFTPDQIAPDFGTRAGALLPSRPWAFRNASRDLAGVIADAPLYAERYRDLKLPIGVLFGTGDNILDYSFHGEALAARCPTVELELIHGGHMIPLTQPERCAAFIDKVAARAAYAPSAPDV